jgi:serine kinase of HPr protein (carbohydrate metabolism regulator)
VAIGGRGVLVTGAPGSGKSALALALIDRGAQLVGDDGVTLEVRDDRAWAAPPPRIAGKLEIRNVGLIDLPTVEVPLALVVRLDRDASHV